MLLATDWNTLHDALDNFATNGERVALVPTMGALHAGHMSLVNLAKGSCERVVASVFVNPTQFGPGEDYHRYPRLFEQDKALLASAGVDVLYAPSAEDIYGENHSTHIHAGALNNRLCGALRPGHFDGVCTIVAKLFNRVLPDVAVFGEKDYQQLLVIKRMARDLDFMVEIIGAPTFREADGLAFSSRNAYLTPAQRPLAAILYQTLNEAAAQIKNGQSVESVLKTGAEKLTQSGFQKVDYLEYCDSLTLEPLAEYKAPSRLLAAAHLGTTRLIDNIAV